MSHLSRLACGCTLLFAVGCSEELRLSEAKSNVDAIRTAQIGFHAVFDEYKATPAHPRPVGMVDANALEWTPNEAWNTVGWAPDGKVRGVYLVTLNAEGTDFTVHGFEDPDGDGRRDHYTATKSLRTTLIPDSN